MYALKAFHIFAVSYIYFDVIIGVTITAIINGFAERSPREYEEARCGSCVPRRLSKRSKTTITENYY